MLLDHRTLMLIAIPVFVVFGMIQYFYGFRKYHDAPSRDIGLASFLFALRSVFHLFENRLPPEALIVAILIIGFEDILVYRSIRGCLGKPSLSALDIWAFYGFMLLGFLAGLVTSFAVDQILYSSYVLFFFGRLMIETIRVRKSLPIDGLVSVLIFVLLTILIRGMWGIPFLFFPEDFFTPEVMLRIMVIHRYLVILLFIGGNIGIHILAMMVVSDRTADERDFARALVSTIGHDLNGYIDGIRQSADLLENRNDPILPVLMSNTIKAKNLLIDLVYWGRSRNPVSSPERHILDLADLVQSAIQEYRDRAYGKGVVLDVRGSIPTVLIRCDKTAAMVVMRNILSNAEKFSLRNGRIVLEATEEPEAVYLTVSDSGSGMDSRVLESIRAGHPVRSRTGSDGEQGTGTGLAIISSICRANGWDLNIQSRPGEGTRVRIGFLRYRV